MEPDESSNPPLRDFNSISPSALSLIIMKGNTTIPYAREAAGLIARHEEHIPDPQNKDLSYWAGVVHFETRYRSVDQLIGDLDLNNFLEISAGFSFRGLHMAKNRFCHYIDTDLPDLIATKKEFISRLETGPFQGNYELLPLNVLDEKKFQETVSRFTERGIVILNEGLLVYLDTEEKKKLCTIIHDILQETGGYWITADIYTPRPGANPGLRMNSRAKSFLEKHRVRENYFESIEQARDFFSDMGFEIEKEAVTDYSKIGSMKYLLQHTSPDDLAKMRNAKNFRLTWRLKVNR